MIGNSAARVLADDPRAIGESAVLVGPTKDDHGAGWIVTKIAAGCVVACVGIAPTLGVAAFTLPVPPSSNDVWPVELATLHGLSPPPDPSPPRS